MTHASYHKHPIVNRRGHGHGHIHATLHSRGHDLASTILSRGETDAPPPDTDSGADNMINLLLLVLGLVFLALLAVSCFFLLRRHRRRQQPAEKEVLPTYSEVKGQNHHGLTIETTHNGRSSTIYIGRDGQPMLANPNSPPHSPDNVPEIHITFPDEHDDQGRPRSGRVLVVRVGDNASVGLEPVQEEQLPAYEKEAKSGFYSVDMDQIGGLKEKDHTFQ